MMVVHVFCNILCVFRSSSCVCFNGRAVDYSPAFKHAALVSKGSLIKKKNHFIQKKGPLIKHKGPLFQEKGPFIQKKGRSPYPKGRSPYPKERSPYPKETLHKVSFVGTDQIRKYWSLIGCNNQSRDLNNDF
eukprot:sb/3474980/